MALFLFLAPLVSLHALASEGMWYLERFGIKEAHEEGIDGSGITIADIDTIVNPDVPWLSDATIITQEKAITQYYGDVPAVSDDFMIAYHATDMISLLSGNGEGATKGNAPLGICPGATIRLYAAVNSESDDLTGGDVYDVAVRDAVDDNCDLISIPAGGKSDYALQYPMLLKALRQNIPVLIAHDNGRSSIDWYADPDIYKNPAGEWLPFEDLLSADDDDEICYWYGLVTVQAIKENYSLQVISLIEDAGTDIAAPGEDIWMQFNGWGDFEAHGGGCSAATTVASGYLALVMQKWPDATGNQILQSMVRTATLPEDSDTVKLPVDDTAEAVLELARDPYLGFGIINPEAMLQEDPSRYPDVNPILYKDVALAVRNAEKSGRAEDLKDPALLEVAAFLDEQLVAEDIARPDFLVTLLGERPVPEPEETDTSASSEEGAFANTAASFATDDAADPTETAPPADDAALEGAENLTSLLPIIIAACVIVAALFVLLVTRKKTTGEKKGN